MSIYPEFDFSLYAETEDGARTVVAMIFDYVRMGFQPSELVVTEFGEDKLHQGWRVALPIRSAFMPTGKLPVRIGFAVFVKRRGPL